MERGKPNLFIEVIADGDTKPMLVNLMQLGAVFQYGKKSVIETSEGSTNLKHSFEEIKALIDFAGVGVVTFKDMQESKKEAEEPEHGYLKLNKLYMTQGGFIIKVVESESGLFNVKAQVKKSSTRLSMEPVLFVGNFTKEGKYLGNPDDRKNPYHVIGEYQGGDKWE